MAIQRVQMRLDGEFDAALAQRAAQEGVSKAELLRTYARERLRRRLRHGWLPGT
ncbi:MAG: ribbon-helix-helix protein, CopG family [Euzebyales bacterium]|nr:ribbon-helix-helix protein, CopG family [Euzebyales bacterium]